MLEEAPTEGLSFPNGLVLWLKKVQLALSGWRKTQTATLTHDFGSITAYTVASTTLPITGVRQGDVAIVNPSVYTQSIVYSAIVTANDTVTIYAQNTTTGGVNPVSTTFRVIVFQQ